MFFSYFPIGINISLYSVVNCNSAAMKLFRNVQSYFDTIGIYCLRTNRARSFNVRFLLLLSSIVITFMSTAAFFVFKASATFEYAVCFYFNITRANSLILVLIIFFKMPKIIKFIGKCERFIERSKLISSIPKAVHSMRE